MRVGPQFLIAIRLLSTTKNLQGRLSITSSGQQLNVYCHGDQVLFMDTSQQFPVSWLQATDNAAISGELQAASAPDARIRAFQAVASNPNLLSQFRNACQKILVDFFLGEIQECRLKQENIGTSTTVLTLPEAFFAASLPFQRSISPDEMLPVPEIVFRQSPDFLARSAAIRLQPAEGYLLSRLEQPCTVNDIVSTVPGEEADTKRSLLKLWAFGLLDSPTLNQMVPRVEVMKVAPGGAPPKATKTPSRVAEDSPERLAPMVHETYLSLSKKDFYSLLNVTNRAEMPEIKAAYYTLARKFHPDRFYGVEDPVLKEKVDVIFSAVNVAYETLKSTKRRTEYDTVPLEKRAIGVTVLNSETKQTKLTQETITKVAEEHFRQAQKAYDEGNYYQAVQFLRSATQIADNVAKYWRQLGIALSRNPQWRKEAEDSFSRALELEPKNPENHLYLGFLYKNSGLKLRARKHFVACRELDPLSEVANREIRLLDAPEEEKEPPQAKKGLLGNIFKKK